MKKFTLATLAIFMFAFGLLANFSEASAAQIQATKTVKYWKFQYPSWQDTPKTTYYYESLNLGRIEYAGYIDRTWCQSGGVGKEGDDNQWVCYYRGNVDIIIN
ncbi:hypothetical protein IC620_09040 [Hazenella sp. IB182357]|uniref:Uncharacterized protein n=1 Tax=Polycladospora coralii TaxID=2771432 RepID=A0A926N985_9BACL|nr:hypothetical protein [Polycladospora coralii]MBD1372501.1 hypothetical protein [Polycladospora coralii]